MQAVSHNPRPRLAAGPRALRLAKSTIATILLLVIAAGCGDRPTAARSSVLSAMWPAASRPSDDLEYTNFTVEENDKVVNVAPTLVTDGDGLLVVDVAESQIRRYSSQGRLLWHAGRRGRGPGEFTSVTVVGRLRSGLVVAGERSGRLTFFDSAGQRPIRTVETRLSQVEEMVVLDDSTLLLSGVGEAGVAGSRLHLWSIPRDTIRASFFAPFTRQRNRAAASLAGYTKAAVRRDTVAAVFGASDTVYFYSLRNGKPAGQVALPSEQFRPAPEREPGRTITNPRERAEWVSAFDLVAGVSWLPDGSLLVAYQSVDADRALTRRWHLLGMTRDGRRTFEFRNFSRLLGTDPESGLAYLVQQNATEPNQWSVASLPPSSR